MMTLPVRYNGSITEGQRTSLKGRDEGSETASEQNSDSEPSDNQYTAKTQ